MKCSFFRNYTQLTVLDTALIELEHEKAVLRKRLSSLEKLNLYIDVLSYKIYEAQHDYETDMEDLRREKEDLLAKQDLSEEDLNALLCELDKRIQERQAVHLAAKSNLETKKAVKFTHISSFTVFFKQTVDCRARKSHENPRFRCKNYRD